MTLGTGWTEADHRELRAMRVAICDIRDILMAREVDDDWGMRRVGEGEPRPVTGCAAGEHNWKRTEPQYFGDIPRLVCACGIQRPVDDAA